MAAGAEEFVQNANEDVVDRLLTRLELAAAGKGKARHYEKREAGRDKQDRVIYGIYLVWDE
jgi:hypothetical protein